MHYEKTLELRRDLRWGSRGWCNGDIEVCDKGLRTYFNIPAGVQRVWVTITNYNPQCGKAYRLFRDGCGDWSTGLGLFWHAEQWLNRNFRRGGHIWATVEYEIYVEYES